MNNGMNGRPQQMGSDAYDPKFTQAELNNPNPNYPQPPYKSANQPSTPGKHTQLYRTHILMK